ncbi:MAG: methyltransferase [Rhizomicrobium sp.]
MTPFARSKLYDIAAASPLLLLYGFGVAGLLPKIGGEIAAVARAPSLAGWLGILSAAASLVFLALQFVLFLLRRLPTAKSQGLLPRAAAVLGSNFSSVLILLPRVQQGPALLVAATALTFMGLAGSIYVAATLGRSFSILPQVRGLVATGPYRRIRHPLYLCEQVANLGIMWQFAQPWSGLVVAAAAALQFPRMYFEERILSQNLPAYAAYAARTARLIPGVY